MLASKSPRQLAMMCPTIRGSTHGRRQRQHHCLAPGPAQETSRGIEALRNHAIHGWRDRRLKTDRPKAKVHRRSETENQRVAASRRGPRDAVAAPAWDGLSKPRQRSLEQMDRPWPVTPAFQTAALASQIAGHTSPGVSEDKVPG